MLNILSCIYWPFVLTFVFEMCWLSSFAHLWIGLFFWCLIFEFFVYSGCESLVRWVAGKSFPPILSLHSGNCLPCKSFFKFDAIPFVNSCYYFLSDKSPIQKIIAYAYILKCLPYVVFQSFRSWGLWSILNWVLYKVRDKNLVLVFYMWISSFPNTIFLQHMFWVPLSRIRWL
jgi:hypothetical protein